MEKVLAVLSSSVTRVQARGKLSLGAQGADCSLTWAQAFQGILSVQGGGCLGILSPLPLCPPPQL